MQNIYGTYGEFQATSFKVHEYIGTTIDFFDTGKMKIDMVDHIRRITKICSKKINGTAPTPAAED